MKKSLFLLFLLGWVLTMNGYAQQKIKITGKVLDDKTGEPLPFVSVYLNTTTTGTATNAAGAFTLTLAPGKQQLVISFTGYEPIIKELESTPGADPLLFRLKPSARALQEVSIQGKRNGRWRENLKIFEEQFLGTSPTATKCKILNPEVLQLTYHPETSTIEAKSKDFLLIRNPELGYLIKYLLIDFKYNIKDQLVSCLGYSTYEPLSGKPLEEKKWELNRLKAYNGSVMHFVRALRTQKLEEEGFYLRKLKKVPNPRRPAAADIAAAKVQLQRGNMEFGLNTGASETLKRADLPEFIYDMDTTRVPYSEYLAINGEEVKMSFPGYFQIIYTHEREDLLYTLQRSNYESTRQAYQYSVMRLLGKSVSLEPKGTFNSPLDIYVDGYWAWEKTGDRLPLDYKAEEHSFMPPQDALVTALNEPLQEFKVARAQEKIYVHLDKPFYVAGEDIWFKTYLVNGFSHTPDSVSRNIYIELISPTGQVVKRNILKVKAGEAAGDFSMEDTLNAGTYTLRAYTNWMRNFSPEFFFTKEISIWNDKKTPATTKIIPAPKTEPVTQVAAANPTPTSPATEIQFFPESGYLVTGIESKIGFKAINRLGKGEDISGMVVDEKGKEVTRFQSLHVGMGSFNLKPESGHTYTARLQTKSGPAFSVPLPVARETGVTVQVNTSDPDFLQVSVNSRVPTATNQEFLLVVQARGQVVYNTRLKSNNLAQPLLVPTINIPTGIAQLTLFNVEKKEPLCERLVFINQHDNLKLSIQADKQKYNPREKIQLNIAITDAAGNPVETNLSLAVTDAKLKPENAAQNIATYLLLSSELKGTIEQPASYFKDDKPETRLALDNLMLTQGWRRFIWQNLLANNLPEIKYPTERHLSLSGQVKQLLNNKPVADGKVVLSIMGPDMQILPTTTNQEGYFTFKNLDIEGSANILVQAQTTKGNQRTGIFLTENKGPEFYIKPLSAAPEDSSAHTPAFKKQYIKQAKTQQKIADTYFYGKNAKVLEEVAVKAKRIEVKAPAIYGAANRVIKIDKNMERFKNILTALQGKDVAIGIKYPPVISGNMDADANVENGGGTLITAYDEEPVITLRGLPIMVLIDGFRVSDFNIVNTIHPSEVESVEIVKNPSGIAMGTEAYNGILAINLRKGNTGRNPVREGSISTKLPGYHIAREFYVSKYDVQKEEHSLPDKRATLYWNPQVKTDASGKATVTFYNADDVTSMNAVLEGVSITGLVGSQTAVIGGK